VWGVGDISDVWQQRLQRERIERERVEQELQVARRIQQASLPKEVPALEGWQITPFYQPAREVGGDFYDFLDLADGRLGVVVGDATGKGVPAALMMASTRSTLRAVAQACESDRQTVLQSAPTLGDLHTAPDEGLQRAARQSEGKQAGAKNSGRWHAWE
jgi:serine phosphatase RsbU (regulator of sigma subunit)